MKVGKNPTFREDFCKVGKHKVGKNPTFREENHCRIRKEKITP